ncbi:MAG: biopolymer transporter ExbD [Verrucomicrobiota bacterium]
MRRTRHLLTPNEPSEINIAPLLDVVFILLIFFIVTAVFVQETGIEVSKPRAASSGELEPRAVLLGIDPAGRVFYAGREIGPEGVRPVVSGLLETEPDRPVIIQSDAATPTQATVRVLDAAKQAGAQSVSLATTKEL